MGIFGLGHIGFGHKVKERLPRVPDGIRIYAIGDIHGRHDLLCELNEAIMSDIARAPKTRVVQLFVGDYIDRGRDSKAVIDWMLTPSPKGVDRVCLKGNHEKALLDFIANAKTLKSWCRYGGLETLCSYGVPLDHPDIEGREEQLHEQFIKSLPQSHLDFLRSLCLFAEYRDYYFVHAGVWPGVALSQQSEVDQLWIGNEFTKANYRFEKVIVHGHSTTHQPYVGKTRIGIDTAAYATGCLTCLVLEDDKQRFITT